MSVSKSIFSKGQGGVVSSFSPRGTLEPLHLVVRSPCLRIFVKKSYKQLKIGKILKGLGKGSFQNQTIDIFLLFSIFFYLLVPFKKYRIRQLFYEDASLCKYESTL